MDSVDLVVRDGQLQGRDEERGRKDSGKIISFYKQNSKSTKKDFLDSPRMWVVEGLEAFY